MYRLFFHIFSGFSFLSHGFSWFCDIFIPSHNPGSINFSWLMTSFLFFRMSGFPWIFYFPGNTLLSQLQKTGIFSSHHIRWLSLLRDRGYRCPVIVVAMVERIHYNRKESIQHSINLVLLFSNISNSGMCKTSFAGPLTENPRLKKDSRRRFYIKIRWR